MKVFRRVREQKVGILRDRALRSEGVEIVRGDVPTARAKKSPVRIDEAEIRSYGEIERCSAEIYTPETVGELRALLSNLARAGRKVTFRAGGCSLDGQSLNEDVVVFLDELDSISIDDKEKNPTVTVEPGATWGDIVRALEPRGLVPFVTVTASRATAGGTASVDGVSRFTSSLGKESTFVERLVLLTVDGALHDLRPDAANESDRALFFGVVGGFGYLGVIVSLTYRVLRPKAEGPPRERLRVVTRVRKTEDIDTFASRGKGVSPPLSSSERTRKRRGACKAIARGLHGRFAALAVGNRQNEVEPQANPVAFYGVVCPGNRPRGLAFESTYVRAERTNPMLQHQPLHPLRPLAEWIARWRFTNELFWWATYLMFQEGVDYIDELFGYTFFMDGNVRTRALERRLGMRTYTLQQTYVLPFTEDSLEAFLERVLAFFEERALVPLLFDVLFVPADDVILSASRGRDGFAVTIAFETMKEAELPARTQALRDLSRMCLSVNGRVHLGKTVCADADVLHAMYGDAIEEFRVLKERVDPRHILRNEFLERVFPSLAVVPSDP